MATAANIAVTLSAVSCCARGALTAPCTAEYWSITLLLCLSGVMMGNTRIAERQKYWLDHTHAAEPFDDSPAEYSRSDDPKATDLTLEEHPSPTRTPRCFFCEHNATFASVIARACSAGISLVLPNAIHIESNGHLGPEQLKALVRASSRPQ